MQSDQPDDNQEDENLDLRLDFEFDEPEEPCADPAIRAGYRDALGRFIMAHNEVDFWMTGILTKAARMLAPDGSLDRLATGDFAERTTNLTLLMKTAPHLALGNVGNGRLSQLNGTRNILAHGHFDQDPWEGSFEIVNRKHRSLTVQRQTNLNADSINKQAAELEQIASHMSSVMAFIDCPVGAEYLKDYPIMLKSYELWELVQVEAAKPEAAAKGSDGEAAPES